MISELGVHRYALESRVSSMNAPSVRAPQPIPAHRRRESRAVLRLLVALALAGSAAWADDTASPQAPAPGDYVIGLRDELRVMVWGEDSLDLTLRVRPDGRISLPLIHDLRVLGLTPEAARTEITSRLSEFMTDPEVTVILEVIGGYRIYVLGEVANPGVLTFDERPRVLQVLAAAGGFTEYAKKTITVLRAGTTDGEKRLEVDYRKLQEGEPGAVNLQLEADDTLLVK